MRTAYLSYDGALDPLGATQVIPYVEGLSREGVEFALITFEKPALLADKARVAVMQERLSRAGVVWHPLRYHKSPRVPATLYDVGAGALLLRRLAQRKPFDLFHCRGDVAAVMARWSRLEGRLLLDLRGFFADERVDAGSWSAGGLLDRSVRLMEKANLARASQIVVLTERGRNVLLGKGVKTPITVIPTAVDLARFQRPSDGAARDFDLVYFGSLGGWYMTEEMLEFVRELRSGVEKTRVLFLTNALPDSALLTRLKDAGISVETAPPERVPEWLARCRATFFFIRASSSKIASCPTKLAEALAMGLPVLTGPGVGDVDEIVRTGNVGHVLDTFSPPAYRQGWDAMLELLEDPGVRQRCRSVAETRLSLGSAVQKYSTVYARVGPQKSAVFSAGPR